MRQTKIDSATVVGVAGDVSGAGAIPMRYDPFVAQSARSGRIWRGGIVASSLRIQIPRDQLEAFCRRFGVEELSLFGSDLRDDFGPSSDVDVMLKFLPGHGFTFENTLEIQDELERIFVRPVDVIEKDRVRNPIRRRAIMSSYQVVYAA